MISLDLDFETHSKVELRKFGMDVYARDPSTKVLMLGYQIDMGDGLEPSPVKIWLPHEEPMPPKLRDMLTDPKVRKIAHNANFELNILRHTLGIPVNPNQWYCTMVMALSLGLPGALETLVRDALKLERKYWKDPEGDRLMRMFSYPSSKATHETHPEEFKRYIEYCRQDVVAEAKVFRILRRYVQNMGKLFDGWVLDQKINARGLPIDIDFIEAAKKIADRSKAQYKQEMIDKTGLANPNSVTQLLPWLTERGYPFASLAKNRVRIAVEDFGDEITDEAKEVIDLRLESNKTSIAKFDAIKRAAWRGRLRNVFQYYGAAATGRYAGRILGQNIPRPDKFVEDYLQEARDMIAAEDLDAIEVFFGKPLAVIASSIRSAIAPRPGRKLVVADLASIETCVIAWWTRCQFWLNVIESGQDAYKAFGSRWLGVPYDEVTKWQRTLSKPATLGCGYRMGAGRAVGTYPDIEKTGLWGYAANMGVEMSKEECKSAVRTYRELSPEIVQAWYDLDEAAMHTVSTGEPTQVGMLSFDLRPPFLRMRLPSGRYLHYCRPRIEDVQLEYEDEETGEIITTTKVGLTYERLSQASRKWVRIPQHGGRYAEQSTQAIALDLLQHGIENVEKNYGPYVIGHFHDEIVTEVDEDSDFGVDELIECMTDLPPWARGLPIGAEGYESAFYRKD